MPQEKRRVLRNKKGEKIGYGTEKAPIATGGEYVRKTPKKGYYVPKGKEGDKRYKGAGMDPRNLDPFNDAHVKTWEAAGGRREPGWTPSD